MLKVLVIGTCAYCQGEVYVFAGEYKDRNEKRPENLPHQVCKGSGEVEKLVGKSRGSSTKRLFPK